MPRLHLDADHEAQAPGGTEAGQLHGVDGRAQVVPLVRDLPHHLLAEDVQGGQGGSGAHRIAAEGGGVGAGPQHVPALLIDQEAAEGQPAGDALGEGDGVGQDAVLLVAEEGPSAADAGLDLIHQQQPVPLGAEYRQVVDEVLVQGPDPALPLDQLQHHSAHVMAGDLGDALHGGLGVPEAVGEGEEIIVKDVLPCGGQGGDRPAVEGIFQGEDGPPPLPVLVKGPLSGQLDKALVGFSPGVCEEGGRHPRPAAEDLCQGPAGLGVEQVGHVAQLGRLDRHRVHPLGVGRSH